MKRNRNAARDELAAERLKQDLILQAEAERDSLLSAIKQHRNATESRLRLLDSRGEAARCMLKPDRDLYEVVDRLEEKP